MKQRRRASPSLHFCRVARLGQLQACSCIDLAATGYKAASCIPLTSRLCTAQDAIMDWIETVRWI